MVIEGATLGEVALDSRVYPDRGRSPSITGERRLQKENLSSPLDPTMPEVFGTAPPGSPAAAFHPKDGHGPALFAGFLGWTLDAFDFFLVILSLTAIAKEFHRSDKEIAFSITLTLAFRPVGAFIFGLMADRYGRRIPLMVDLVFYSVVEVLTGFAHSFTTFLVLRALFGIGM